MKIWLDPWLPQPVLYKRQSGDRLLGNDAQVERLLIADKEVEFSFNSNYIH